MAAAAYPQSKIVYPEDLGPGEIDVSDYPAQHQETYRTIFLSVFDFLKQTSRVVNSPLIEMDPAFEESERRGNPGLFGVPEVFLVTKDGWKKYVTEIQRRPPCCGACPVLSKKEAKALWQFLVYDSIRRKTGPKAQAWAAHRKALLARFKKEFSAQKIKEEHVP